ncbi:putative Actin family, ATPase, nucleotide binding domain-containing protein [Helianthus annuus]|nr:putative Actin family, ATPase, nucleotide binding domain-containing protein [Helianthus annuus]
MIDFYACFLTYHSLHTHDRLRLATRHPIYEGYALPHAILRLDLAGRYLTVWLMRFYQNVGIHSPQPQNGKLLRDMKEKRAYIALDYVRDMRRVSNCPASRSLPLVNNVNIPKNQSRFFEQQSIQIHISLKR